MSALTKILSRARSRPATIALPEGTDPRIIDAATRAAQDGIAKIILIGNTGEITSQLTGDVDGISVLDPATSMLRDGLIADLVAARGHKGMTPDKARAAIDDPLVFAAMLVRSGHADGTLSGAAHSTADVVRTALQLIGRAPATEIVSSVFLMELPETAARDAAVVGFADCALVIDPSAEQMAAIACATGDTFAALTGETPRVAMLSFSTLGSGKHSSVSKVAEATTLAKTSRLDLSIDGELQFDAAFVASVGATKAPGSGVAGAANVFVFPNLDAGNIGYKIAQRIGGAAAIGPILQGLARPANDLSRGCTVEDVYHMIAVTGVQTLT